jgi:hypothetical protein
VGRTRTLLLFVVLVVLVGVGLRATAGLADQGVRGGIVSLELVGSASGAAALIGDGEAPIAPAEVAVVRTAVLWDLTFIAVYTVGLVGAAWLLVPMLRLQRLRKRAKAIVVVALAPAALDVAENAALWIAVAQSDTDAWFLVATSLALAKFLLLAGLLALFVGAIASAVGTPAWLYGRLDAEPQPETTGTPLMDKDMGIALSGGGVRAASISLGALQELERGAQPIGWETANAVTAVSGGAYMAGAWQLGRDRQGDSDAWRLGHALEDDPRRRDLDRPGPEEQHLLNNLGYLTSTYPRGLPEEPGAPVAQDSEGNEQLTRRMRSRPAVWATILTGFMINVAVIAAVLFVVVIPLGLLLRWLTNLDGACAGVQTADVASCLAAQPRMWVPPTAWILAWLACSMVWVVTGKLVLRKVRMLHFLKAVVQGSLLTAVSLALILFGLPLLVALLGQVKGPATIAAALAAAVGTIGAVARMLRRALTALAPKLGGIAFLVLLLIVSGLVAKAIWLELPIRTALVWLTISVAALGLTWAIFSPELWSMFAFYRGKLRSAYALHRVNGQARPYVDDPDADTDPQLVREPELGSYSSRLTICAAANATTKGVRTHYRIPALSCTFDDTHVQMFVPIDDQGSTTVYRCTLGQMSRAYPGAGFHSTTRRITTMFAVALSGAAVSPAMGRFRIGLTSMLLAFANIRLGCWLPNPRYVALGGEASDENNRFPRVRIGYLFKEFLGIHDPTDPFVYVSDGGHWENSGLVELLRGTMPREAILIDAEAGRAATVLQLTQAIDLAKLECDVDIFIDLEPLRGFASEQGGPVFAQQSVTLGVLKQGPQWGLIWYCKPILTKSSPTPLLAHREIDPEFPATTTLDQFFDTSTYLAYRDLGRDNAAQIKAARAKLAEILRRSTTADQCLQLIYASEDRHWAEAAFAELLNQQDDAEPNSAREQLFSQVKEIMATVAVVTSFSAESQAAPDCSTPHNQ